MSHLLKPIRDGDAALNLALRRSVWVHVLIAIILLIPLLLDKAGCVDPYVLPSGGKVAAKPVKQVRVKRKPRVIHNPHSDIAFNFPDFQQIDLQLEKLTEHAFAGRVGAGAGSGAGAGYGGPGGGKVRFIRLQYDGGDWDQDYGLSADANMLREFGSRTGIPVAERTEHVKIRDVLKFPPDQSPPFLFITGEQSIRASDHEVGILREYLTDRGGMIFADNGGGRFHGSFTGLMRRVMPEARFVEIPIDDEIFQRPYSLPGAPPLWHHSGYRALGIRHQGRWVVFYHQGDLGDAWKDGHSGAPTDSWQAAYETGVNVIDYAVRNYIRFMQRP